jgi:lambda family phage portal protein
MKKNIIDRTLSYLSSSAGANIARNRAIEASMESFTAASTSRGTTKVWNPKALSADGDSIRDLPKIRERSRDAVRNQPLAKSVIKTMADNVISTGLSFQSTVDQDILNIDDTQKEKLEKQIETHWSCWADSEQADITGINNYQRMQKLVYKSYLENGDAFVLFTKTRSKKRDCNLVLQMIEADRITNEHDSNDTKSLTAGIHKDRFGKHFKYDVASRLLINTIQDNEARTWRKINKFDKSGRTSMIHVFNQERFEQTRGIPFLATVLETVYKISKLQESELTSAMIESLFTVFVKSQDGQASIDPYNTIKQKRQDLPADCELGSGSIIQLPDDVDITVADPKRPNSKFESFFYAMIKIIGSETGIPFEIILKQFSSSFSASKAAILMFWQMIQRERYFVNTTFNNIVLERVIEDGIMNGKIDAPLFNKGESFRKAYLNGNWQGTSRIVLEPMAEVKAARERIDLGISTRSIESMSLTGTRFVDNRKQLNKEEKLISEGTQIEEIDETDQERAVNLGNGTKRLK